MLGHLAQPVEVAIEDRLARRAKVVGLLFEANRVEGAVEILRSLVLSDDPELKVSALQKLNQLHEFLGDCIQATNTLSRSIELDYRFAA